MVGAVCGPPLPPSAVAQALCHIGLLHWTALMVPELPPAPPSQIMKQPPSLEAEASTEVVACGSHVTIHDTVLLPTFPDLGHSAVST